MPFPHPPPSWGADELSKFIDAGRANEFATFSNRKSEVRRQLDIDLQFRKAIDGLNHSKDWFAGFFMLRAHSNWLGAIRMCWSGQIPETYALLRSCLENALYGLFLAKNPAHCETWLKRHNDASSRRKCRDAFKFGDMIALAKSLDAKEGDVVETLYERAIDYGAHPNERALTQSLEMDDQGDRLEFLIVYLEGDAGPIDLAMKTVAQVGVNALSLFRIVYKTRFDLLDISHALDHIKRGI